MMNFEYSFPKEVVDYLLTAVNRVQISGVQSARDLLQVVELLQNPTNKDQMEKEQFEQLRTKFEEKPNTKKNG